MTFDFEIIDLTDYNDYTQWRSQNLSQSRKKSGSDSGSGTGSSSRENFMDITLYEHN